MISRVAQAGRFLETEISAMSKADISLGRFRRSALKLREARGHLLHPLLHRAFSREAAAGDAEGFGKGRDDLADRLKFLPIVPVSVRTAADQQGADGRFVIGQRQLSTCGGSRQVPAARWPPSTRDGCTRRRSAPPLL